MVKIHYECEIRFLQAKLLSPFFYINTSQVNIGIKPSQLLLKVKEVSDDYLG